MKYFICEEIVQSVTYFISEYSKIISKHRKKLVWTFGQEAQTETRQKKISWNFWDFF